MSANGLPNRRTRQPAVSFVVRLSCLVLALASIASCASLAGAPAPTSPPTRPTPLSPVVVPTPTSSAPTATFAPVEASRSSSPTATFAPIPRSAAPTYQSIPTSTPTSTPVPTPTITPTPTPTSTPTPAAGVAFSSLSSPVSRGGTARADVATTPNTRCTIKVVYKGVTSNAAGLGPKTSDASGSVSWSWKVASNTPKGSWPVTVTCGSASATKSFTVQ